MMKIALIGGSGFVGTRLIDLLNQNPEKYQCKNLDLQPSHFFNSITTIGDVRNKEELKAFLHDVDLVILLAAQHRDDVTPVSLYYDTNVTGMRNTLEAMEYNGVKRIIFFSSVAVYGINKVNPNENSQIDPFNHYGKSKWEAEKFLQEWHKKHEEWNIDIIRPTVIFGERNRGNVYNLLKQISSGKFLMVGKGENFKSMAYVGNVVAFVKYLIDNVTKGYNVFNYIDKPDKNMNELIETVGTVLKKKIPSTHFPYWLGMMGGYGFDLIAKLTGKKLTISSVRVKKFCATTQFDSKKAHSSGFKPPFTIDDGLRKTLEFEFLHPQKDDIVFVSE